VLTEALTVWYDDDCGLCGTVVRWCRGRVDSGVTFRSNRGLTDPALRATAADAIVVTAGDSAWRGVEAVRRVMIRTGWWGRYAAAPLDWPVVRRLAARGYRAVATNRAALSARLGLRSECQIDP